MSSKIDETISTNGQFCATKEFLLPALNPSQATGSDGFMLTLCCMCRRIPMRILNAAWREVVITSSFDQGTDKNGRYIFPAIAVRYPYLFDGRSHLARSSQFPRSTFRRRAIGMTIRSCGIELYRARALHWVGRILGFHFFVDRASASSAGNECHTYRSQDLPLDFTWALLARMRWDLFRVYRCSIPR